MTTTTPELNVEPGADTGAGFPLASVQRWMQAVLTHPDSIGAALREESAHAALPLTADDVEQLIAPSTRLTGGQRLAVYYRSYFARLLECLEGQFKVLRHALGDELFRDFALEYLRAYPSRSYTLGELGAYFAAFLAETRPDRDAPPAERETWPDFMIDLARLERAAFTLFDAPGHEGQLPLAPTVADADLRLAPCFALLRFRYPVNAYYQAVYHGAAPGLPPAQPSFLAITRVEYQLGMFELTPLQYGFLYTLRQSQLVEEALAQLAAQPGLDAIQAQALWQSWREPWLATGFFTPKTLEQTA